MVCRSMLLMAVTVLCVTAGCPDKSVTGPAQMSFAGQAITVAVPEGWGFPIAWELPIQEWSAQTNARCTIREYNPAAALAAPGKLITDEDDLVLLPLNRLGDIAAGDALAEIPQALRSDTNLHWLDVFQGLREQVASRAKRPVALPIAAPVLVVYFREDLLQQARLSPPRTWAEYDQLVSSLDRWAPGLTVAEPWGEPFRATMFLARALPFVKHPSQFSVFWDIETGDPLMDNAGFVRALEASRQAVSKAPADVLGYGPADCRREILSGRAALAIGYESGAKATRVVFCPTDEAASTTKLDRRAAVPLGVCRLPGSTEAFHQSNRRWESIPGGDVNHASLSGFGGLCAAVSARSSPAERDAAWHLLMTLTGENLSNVFPPGTRTPCRESHVNQPGGWTGDELHDAERYKYLNAVSQSLRDTRLVAELPVPGHAEFRKALTDGLTTVLSGQAEAEPALKAVAARWRTIAEQHGGASQIRDAYRTCLGLTVQE